VRINHARRGVELRKEKQEGEGEKATITSTAQALSIDVGPLGEKRVRGGAGNQEANSVEEKGVAPVAKGRGGESERLSRSNSISWGCHRGKKKRFPK